MTLPSQHLSISIDCSPERVYKFVADPTNLPQWASGLSQSIECIEGEWIADSPMGRIKVKFAPSNDFGVLDHEVTLPSGVAHYNPMRVLPNGNGSEVIFTLYQHSNVGDEALASDVKAILHDLKTLKSILET